ncbi:MAG: metal-dependent hydrolase, partial [Saprospiraceae bacterium]|nr:metal-dependent hydrolase [Saprospiraceae bacterium]
MDSITQAVLGAAIGEAVAGRKIGHKAAIAGAVIGTIPDLDVLFIPFLDEMTKMSFHRGYSHSILFCLVTAFLIAFAMSKIKWIGDLSYRKAWMVSFFALFTHVLLDAFTTYGTQLLLPFSDWRISFDSINIVDPIYTLPLMTGLGFSIYLYNKKDSRRSLPNNLGLIASSIYLLFTLANKQHIQKEFYNQLKSQNLPSYGLLTVPVKIGNVQW